MPIPDWQYPETWSVGDNLDAETLNRRVRDQNTILLRRPMLIAHASADASQAGGSVTMSWDTIDKDTDGMVITDTPATTFYIQRDGTYAMFLTVTMAGNGSSCPTMLAGLNVNGSTRRWDEISGMSSTSGQQLIFCSQGMIFMSAGEYVQAWTYHNSASSETIKAVNNTPRLVIMWLGAS